MTVEKIIVPDELKDRIRGIHDSGRERVDVPDGCFVSEGDVYQNVFGGQPKKVGYVENGVAFQQIIGGPNRPMSSSRFG